MPVIGFLNKCLKDLLFIIVPIVMNRMFSFGVFFFPSRHQIIVRKTGLANTQKKQLLNESKGTGKNSKDDKQSEIPEQMECGLQSTQDFVKTHWNLVCMW